MPRSRTPMPSPSVPLWPEAGFEYQDINLSYDGSWATELDKLGIEGWKLVFMVHDEGVDDDSEVRAVFMRPRSGVGTVAKAEGRVTKRKSKTSDLGHETVGEDEDSNEDAP